MTIIFPTLSSASMTYINPAVENVEKIVFNQEKGFLTKTVNFNSSPADGFALGVFATEESPIWKEVERIENNLKEADQTLKEKGLSINKLANSKPHEPYFEIDGLKIDSSHLAYLELMSVMKKLLGLPWRLKDGVRLNESMTTLANYKDGKVIKNSSFNIQKFICNSPDLPTRCKVSPWGSILLK